MIGTADQAGPFMNKLCLRAGLDHYEIHASSLRMAGSAHKDGLLPIKASAARVFDTLFRPGRATVERPSATPGGPFRMLVSGAEAKTVVCIPLQFATRGRAGAYFLGRTLPVPGGRQARAIQLALTRLLEQLHAAGAVSSGNGHIDPREILCQEAIARNMSMRQASRFSGMAEREIVTCVANARRRLCAVSLTQTVSLARQKTLV